MVRVDGRSEEPEGALGESSAPAALGNLRLKRDQSGGAVLRLRACQHLALAYAETDHLAIDAETANRDARSVGTIESWYQARRTAALSTRANTELAHALARLPDHYLGVYQKLIERPAPQETQPAIRGVFPASMPDATPRERSPNAPPRCFRHVGQVAPNELLTGRGCCRTTVRPRGTGTAERRRVKRLIAVSLKAFLVSLPSPLLAHGSSGKGSAPPGPEASDRVADKFSAVLSLREAPDSMCLSVVLNDESIFESQSRTGLLPASLMKVDTATAALEVIRPEEVYSTEVFARADAMESITGGVLRGDLYLIGQGDPGAVHARLRQALRSSCCPHRHHQAR